MTSSGCLRSLFSSKDEFKSVVGTYVIHNGRDLRFIKNDSKRVRVVCKEGCDWVAPRSKDMVVRDIS